MEALLDLATVEVMSFFCISNRTWEGLQGTAYPHLQENKRLTLEVSLPRTSQPGAAAGSTCPGVLASKAGRPQGSPAPTSRGPPATPEDPFCTLELTVSVPLPPFCPVCRRPPWLFLTGAGREPQAKSWPLTDLGKQAWTGSRGQLRTSPLSNEGGWTDP